MKFCYPEYLMLLSLIPIVIVFFIINWGYKKKLLSKFAQFSLVTKLVPVEGWKVQKVKMILLIVSLLFLILGLSGPQIGSKVQEIKRYGIDVIIAIDCSNSMLAEDIKPNRLQRAKYELSSLIDLLQGDRVGIIVFAGTAFLQCPLTLDYTAAKMFLDIIDTSLMPVQGTAIGAAIRLAIDSFPKEELKYKALVLLTDGEETANSDPIGAAEEAKKYGIRIYTIGYGRPEGEIIPLKDRSGNIIGYKKDKKGEVVVSKLDEDLLQRISYITGGKYFRAIDGSINPQYIYEEISGMEKKVLQSKFRKMYENRFQYFIFISLLLLTIEFLLPEKRLPIQIYIRRYIH